MCTTSHRISLVHLGCLWICIKLCHCLILTPGQYYKYSVVCCHDKRISYSSNNPHRILFYYKAYFILILVSYLEFHSVVNFAIWGTMSCRELSVNCNCVICLSISSINILSLCLFSPHTAWMYTNIVFHDIK